MRVLLCYAAMEAAEPIKIKCFTWNVGNAMPREAELAEWLPERDEEFDLVVVGTQENAFKAKNGTADSLSKSANMDEEGSIALEQEAKASLPVDAPQGIREKDARLWDQMVSARLGKAYVLVKHVVLWEMRLSVYAKASAGKGGGKGRITNVQAATSATGGPGGVFGNKGGLVVRLDYQGTSFAFVSCHLAAHAPKLAQRNQNCQEILTETRKSIGAPLAHPHAPAGCCTCDRPSRGASWCVLAGSIYLDAVSQFDHVFWMGDLNYRSDLNAAGASPPYAEETAHHQAVLRLIEDGAWSQLLAADQLNMCKAHGEAFHGFREGSADFQPTFKVQRKPGVEYKDQRIPSYCMRAQAMQASSRGPAALVGLGRRRQRRHGPPATAWLPLPSADSADAPRPPSPPPPSQAIGYYGSRCRRSPARLCRRRSAPYPPCRPLTTSPSWRRSTCSRRIMSPGRIPGAPVGLSRWRRRACRSAEHLPVGTGGESPVPRRASRTTIR